MKRYRIQLPTSEQCKELGIKFEGQVMRTQLWLMGVASGVSFMSAHVPADCEQIKFNLSFATTQCFYVDTNSDNLIAQVADYLKSYGVEIEPS